MGRKKKNPQPESMDEELEPSPKYFLKDTDILSMDNILDLDDDLSYEDMFPELC